MSPQAGHPKLERAKEPGVCWNCGQAVNKGDKVRMVGAPHGGLVPIHDACFKVPVR